MTPDSNGILYLEETDPITPFQTTINALQAATSSAIEPFVADTGWNDISLTTISGWTLNSLSVRRVGPLIQWICRVSYSGGGVTAGPTGDIANTVFASGLPAIYRPWYHTPLASGPTGRVANCTVTPAGEFMLTAVAPASTWTAGGNNISGTYNFAGMGFAA